MSAYLAYSFSVRLPEKEQIEIDRKVNKNQKDFYIAFQQITEISLSVYFVYLFAVSPAYAFAFEKGTRKDNWFKLILGIITGYVTTGGLKALIKKLLSK